MHVMTFGESMRALMTERDISLRKLAKTIPADVGGLSKISRDLKRPSKAMAERIDVALDAGGELAALRPMGGRRHLVVQPVTEDEGMPQIIARLSDALYGDDRLSTGQANVQELNRRAAQAWQLRQSAEYDALADLLVLLLADTHAALDFSGDEARMSITGAYVHANNAVSSVLKRIAPELGAVAADRALQAARLVDDELLTGAATLRLANVFLAAGRHRLAVDTASDGADALMPFLAAAPTVAATWGALLLTAAVGAASLDDGPGPAWEFLGQAKAASSLLGGAEHADLHAIFGPANVAIHGVHIATELGDPHEALRRAEHVEIDTLPTSLAERRSAFLLDVARCHHLVGDQDAALETLLDAEQIAPQEIRYSGAAGELTARLLCSPGGTRPELLALVDRINTREE